MKKPSGMACEKHSSRSFLQYAQKVIVVPVRGNEGQILAAERPFKVMALGGALRIQRACVKDTQRIIISKQSGCAIQQKKENKSYVSLCSVEQ